MPITIGPRNAEAVKANKSAVLSGNLSNPSNYTNDDQRYQAAVALADNSLDGQRNVKRSTYKNTIDKYFKQLGGTKSGRDMRGENAWTDFVDRANEFTTDFNNGLGSLIDAGFDSTVGNLAHVIGGKDAGDAVKNFATGEDVAILPDIATDVALAATLYGIPLVVAKEGFRNADNFSNFINGKDAVTLKDLDAGQRAANAVLGFGGTALAAVPGIGKVKALSKVAKSEAKAAKEALPKAQKAYKEAAEELGEREKDLPEAKKAYEEAMAAATKKAETAADGGKNYDTYVENLGGKVEDRIGKGGVKQQPFMERPDAGEFAKPGTSSTEFKNARNAVKTIEEANEEAAAANLKFSPFKKVEEAKAAKDAAEAAAKKSESDFFFEAANNDIKGFVDALKNIRTTYGEARERASAQTELRRKMRGANKDLKDSVKSRKEYKDIDLDRREQALLDQFTTYDDLHVPRKASAEEASKLLDELEEKAGVSAEQLVGKNNLFKGGNPITSLHPISPFGEAMRSVALAGNKSLLPANVEASLRGIERAGKLAEKEPKGELAKKLNALGIEYAMNPSGAADMAKRAGVNIAQVMGAMPLASVASGGGFDYDMFAKDAANGNQAKYVMALLAPFTGRNYARSAIPGISGRLGSYQPYAAISTKDVINQFEGADKTSPSSPNLEEVYNNILNKGGK